MKTNIWGYTAPSAFVTKGRQRIKQYNDTVYLNNGDEFEIELYNPTQNKVLAKIELNGKSLGAGGIIIRPGERVFLDRYFDVARKFLFETYKVSGNNAEVARAIENNGKVSIKFYGEYIPPPVNWGQTWTNYSSPTINTPFFNTGTSTVKSSSACFTSSVTFDSVDSDNTLSFTPQGVSDRPKPRLRSLKSMVKNEVETGRIEKGSSSGQSFTYDNTVFNAYYTWSTEWKILPISEKLKTIEDLVVYCGECGAKRKKESHKFCPNCGSKF